MEHIHIYIYKEKKEKENLAKLHKSTINYIIEKKRIIAVGKDQKETYEPFELVHPKTTTDTQIKKKKKKNVKTISQMYKL